MYRLRVSSTCVKYRERREPGDNHHGIILSQGNGVLLECQNSRHSVEDAISCQYVPAGRFKRWEEVLVVR